MLNSFVAKLHEQRRALMYSGSNPSNLQINMSSVLSNLSFLCFSSTTPTFLFMLASSFSASSTPTVFFYSNCFLLLQYFVFCLSTALSSFSSQRPYLAISTSSPIFHCVYIFFPKSSLLLLSILLLLQLRSTRLPPERLLEDGYLVSLARTRSTHAFRNPRGVSDR